jgi:hypothetical protein
MAILIELEEGMGVQRCSRWLYLLSGKKEWEYRYVDSGGGNGHSISRGTGGAFRHGDDR